MGSFQGKRVSGDWEVVLEAAWEDGVRFQLNSGQRTLQEQQVLYDKMLNGTGNLAARPSRDAPHIRVGRDAHALDVDSFAYRGGENRLQAWLKKQGTNPRNTVPGESWHLEITESELNRLAKRLSAKWKDYTPSEKRWIEEYDKLFRARKDKPRREVLRRVMKEQRQNIWQEAQKSGWRRSNRVKRYASLRARS